MALQNLTDVVGNYTGLSRKVLEYSLLMKRLVDRAKQPGFSVDSWEPLKELIEIETFERVGNFKEVMNWTDYVNFLTPWAMSSDWDGLFKRVTEVGNVVFLELEERVKGSGYAGVANSVSVYEFNAAGKIEHLDIYLQMELPSAGMLENYENVL